MNYCNPEGFRNEIKELLARGDIDTFYHWFDGGGTKEGAFEKGKDVFARVISPYMYKYRQVKANEKLVALDLGYGAGTKIQAALGPFSTVYGVDVHEEFDFVFDNLNIPKDREVRLLAGDGTTIPVGSTMVDFLYSWSVFGRLGTIKNVEQYLKEIYRVLKPGGVAVLFFVRLLRSGKNQTWGEVEADMVKETTHPTGYREGGPKSKVKSINLVVSMYVMEQLAEAAKFKVLEKTASWSHTVAGRVYHGQYGIVLMKPKLKKAVKKPVIKRTIKRRKK